jgi:hypothetical protein
MAEIGCFHEVQFVFLDEAGVDDHTGERRRGWSSVGSCVMRAAFLQGQKYSILPALDSTGIIALDIFEGAVNKKRDSFLSFEIMLYAFIYPSTLFYLEHSTDADVPGFPRFIT